MELTIFNKQIGLLLRDELSALKESLNDDDIYKYKKTIIYLKSNTYRKKDTNIINYTKNNYEDILEHYILSKANLN